MVSKTEEIKTKKTTSETSTTAADFASTWDESVDSFDALDLKELLIRGIYGRSFTCFMFS